MPPRQSKRIIDRTTNNQKSTPGDNFLDSENSHDNFAESTNVSSHVGSTNIEKATKGKNVSKDFPGRSETQRKQTINNTRRREDAFDEEDNEYHEQHVGGSEDDEEHQNGSESPGEDARQEYDLINPVVHSLRARWSKRAEPFRSLKDNDEPPQQECIACFVNFECRDGKVDSRRVVFAFTTMSIPSQSFPEFYPTYPVLVPNYTLENLQEAVMTLIVEDRHRCGRNYTKTIGTKLRAPALAMQFTNYNGTWIGDLALMDSVDLYCAVGIAVQQELKATVRAFWLEQDEKNDSGLVEIDDHLIEEDEELIDYKGYGEQVPETGTNKKNRK